MSERKFLHTVGDLIDQMSISLMKSIKIDKAEYQEKMSDIGFDLEANYQDKFKSGEIHIEDFTFAVLVVMLSNCTIWHNEETARSKGKGGRLRFTHSINGVRNRAKNELNKMFGERVDSKIDCLAADLPPELGNWNVFDDED